MHYTVSVFLSICNSINYSGEGRFPQPRSCTIKGQIMQLMTSRKLVRLRFTRMDIFTHSIVYCSICDFTAKITRSCYHAKHHRHTKRVQSVRTRAPTRCNLIRTLEVSSDSDFSLTTLHFCANRSVQIRRPTSHLSVRHFSGVQGVSRNPYFSSHYHENENWALFDSGGKFDDQKAATNLFFIPP